MTLTLGSYCDMDADADEIFYSDEESSDSEIQKASRISRYFSEKSESIFSERLRHNSQGAVSPETAITSPIYIDSPINQISSGMGCLLREEGKRSGDCGKQLSYSAIMKKEPFASTNIKPTTATLVKMKPRASIAKTDVKKIGKVTESALAAGYRFKAKDPMPDPRYPADQQLMIGPIPGHIDHDNIYNNLRSIFQARGAVCFMFIHKSAVKDLESGNPVKFGYVVFAEKGIAQKVVKEEFVTFGGGYKVKVKAMSK